MIATSNSYRAGTPLVALLGLWLCGLASGCGASGGRQHCACGPYGSGYFGLPPTVCFGHSSTCWHSWPGECVSCPTYNFPPPMAEPAPAKLPPEPAIQPAAEPAPVPDPSPSDEPPPEEKKQSRQRSSRHGFSLAPPTHTPQHEILQPIETFTPPPAPPVVAAPAYGYQSSIPPVQSEVPIVGQLPVAAPQALIEPPPAAVQQEVAPPPVAVAPMATDTVATAPIDAAPEQAAISQSPPAVELEPAATAAPSERSNFLFSENSTFVPPTAPLVESPRAIAEQPPVQSEPVLPRKPQPSVVKAEKPAPKQAAAKQRSGRFQLPALFSFGSPRTANKPVETPVEPATVTTSEPIQVPAAMAPPPPVLTEAPAPQREQAPRVQMTAFESQSATLAFIPASMPAPRARYQPEPIPPVLTETPFSATPEVPATSQPIQAYTPTQYPVQQGMVQSSSSSQTAAPPQNQATRAPIPEVLVDEPNLPPIVSPASVRRPPPPVLTGEN